MVEPSLFARSWRSIEPKDKCACLTGSQIPECSLLEGRSGSAGRRMVNIAPPVVELAAVRSPPCRRAILRAIVVDGSTGGCVVGGVGDEVGKDLGEAVQSVGLVEEDPKVGVVSGVYVVELGFDPAAYQRDLGPQLVAYIGEQRSASCFVGGELLTHLVEGTIGKMSAMAAHVAGSRGSRNGSPPVTPNAVNQFCGLLCDRQHDVGSELAALAAG